MNLDLPTYKQILTMLHIRTIALEEIRAKLPDTEASKIAGQALCHGLNSQSLTELFNDLEDHQTAVNAKTEGRTQWLDELTQWNECMGFYDSEGEVIPPEVAEERAKTIEKLEQKWRSQFSEGEK